MGHDQQAGAKNPWRNMVRLAKGPKTWREEPYVHGLKKRVTVRTGVVVLFKGFWIIFTRRPLEKYSIQFEGICFSNGWKPTHEL